MALGLQASQWSLLFLILLSATGCDTPRPSAAVPEEALPSLPEIFAPTIVSSGLSERDTAFSPDMNHVYFTIWSGTFGTIVTSRKTESGGWTSPETVSFSGHYSDMEPFVTVDGSRLFFASNRPETPGQATSDYDLWYVDKEASGWGEPVRLGSPVNSPADEFYPSVSGNGNLYFTAARPGAVGGEDIFVSPLVAGAYGPPVSVGRPVNSELDEFNAVISPDESTLVYTIWGRDNDQGGGDLYIARKNEAGEWQAPVNLGEGINSPFLDFCPAFSPDGSQFFFTSRRNNLASVSEEQRSYSWLKESLTSPGNGGGDIYRVDARVLDSPR